METIPYVGIRNMGEKNFLIYWGLRTFRKRQGELEQVAFKNRITDLFGARIIIEERQIGE